MSVRILYRDSVIFVTNSVISVPTVVVAHVPHGRRDSGFVCSLEFNASQEFVYNCNQYPSGMFFRRRFSNANGGGTKVCRAGYHVSLLARQSSFLSDIGLHR